MALTRVTSGGIAEGVSIRFGAGTVSAPSITFQGDTATGIYKSGTNTFDFVSNGNSKLTIGPSGVSLPGDLSVQNFKATDGTVNAPSISFANNTTSGIFRDNSDTGIWKLVANGGAKVTIHKTNGFIVESGVPSSLQGTLSVTGNTTLNSNVTLVGSGTVATEYFKIQNGAGADRFVVDSFNGNTSITGTLDVTDNTTLRANVTLVGSNVTNTEFFRIQNGSGADRFVVDSFSGVTTIQGATTINNNLTINNTFGLTTELINSSSVTFGNATASNTPSGSTLKGTDGSGTNIAGADIIIAGGRSTGSATGGSIIFRGAPSGTSGTSLNNLQNVLAITPTGVGVNTLTPNAAYKIDVVGDINVTGKIREGGTALTSLVGATNIALIIALS
jgi:hypothetical protein